ncbi:iron uptake transporter permease EfeU [Arthrobacter sp. FW306-2-2C-D06B]|uniref:iron uptake transporter permease EfeU n=1 Tax=Arthrobacter sp. FW306-2-2C-D06B TaxID=2879618 RepID=UPI001F17F944|nr:iron uptake transporter permease EfeU [Arthrobacter sp. FW306-2-2C-D06B]UKA57900.1 FTR1 family protein [Arthrobacter sp. FW306-2-2C-D06B]
MTANFLIGLREGLEATLIVVLLMAYLVKTGRRSLLPRLWAGVGIAVAVSIAFGALLTFGPQGLTFAAQEAIGGGLSVAAVALVTWMVFWMARTARSLGGELKSQVDKMADGAAWGLVVVAALAVGREGLETALFLWAAAQAAGESSQPLLGALLGLAVAAGLGYLLHRGVLKVNLSRFFTWTGVGLIVIAGGVLAYGVHDLQEAGILPGLHNLAFDVSAAIPPSSWYGTLLKGTLNLSPATTWLEAGAWLLYVLPVLYFYIRANGSASAKSSGNAAAPQTPSQAAKAA